MNLSGSGINFLADEFDRLVFSYLQFDVAMPYYADISYILHDDDDILPLLKQTLITEHQQQKQTIHHIP